MKRAALLLLLPSFAGAAPFIVSDPYPSASNSKPTHCGLYLDAAAKVESAVTTDAAGTYCKLDMAGVTVGSHSAKLSFIVRDVVWGALEGAQSVPFSFARPLAPTVAPSGVSLSP
jgi:hypothetical protein